MKLAKKSPNSNIQRNLENSNGAKKRSSLKDTLDSDFDLVFDAETQGELTFHMPEEFYNPNKKIAKIRIINIHDEVKVIEGAALKNFEAKDIKHLIEASDDVKKVVIEQVTVNDSKRLSLLYNETEDVDTDLSEAVRPILTSRKPQVINTPQPKFLKDLETKINSQFLDRPVEKNNSKQNDRTQKVLSENQAPELEGSPDYMLMSEMEKANKRLLQEKENGYSDEEFSKRGSDRRNDQRRDEEDSNIFALKAKQEALDPNDYLPDSFKDDGVDAEEATYKRQTLIRKTRKNKPNDYYYQARNHRDLFKVGNSYYEDVKAGHKSFCFTSVNAEEEQQKTVFGITAFFNYHSDLKVTIVTDSIEDTYYLKHMKGLERKTRSVLGGDFHYEYYAVDGIDIIELSEFRNIFNHLNHFTFNEFLDELLTTSGLVLWDLPEIGKLDKEKEMYFPITMVVEYVSLIVRSEENKIKDIDRMLDYYHKYNISVKGLIFSNSSDVKKVGTNG